jgi:peptide/nickel transport system permease protein
MSRARYLLGRVGFVVAAAYGLLSVTFLFIAFTPDPNETFVQMAAALSGQDTNAALEGYRSARNRDRPLLTRYLDWMYAYTTFHWGYSRTLGDPVIGLILERSWVSAVYVVPGLAIASLGGGFVGMWEAIRPNSTLARLSSVGSALVGAIPLYWLGYLLALMSFLYLGYTKFFIWVEGGPLSPVNLPRMVLAAVTIASGVMVVQVRYVRSGTAEFLRTPAAKLLRMKGGRDRHLAKHALRLLGGSFLTLFLTETLTVLFLGMYVVEAVFDIPGFGALSLYAINQRDIPLLLGTTFVPVLFGLLGTLLQDIVESIIDPRVE